MTKREFVDKNDLLMQLDNFDWQELYLPIHFKDNVIDETITVSERDIVKPYLDKIRAEIENDWQLKKYPSSPFSCGLRRAIEIIDKYKAESEKV